MLFALINISIDLRNVSSTLHFGRKFIFHILCMRARLLKEIKLLVTVFFSQCPIFLGLGLPKSSTEILTRPKVIYDFVFLKLLYCWLV